MIFDISRKRIGSPCGKSQKFVGDFLKLITFLGLKKKKYLEVHHDLFRLLMVSNQPQSSLQDFVSKTPFSFQSQEPSLIAFSCVQGLHFPPGPQECSPQGFGYPRAPIPSKTWESSLLDTLTSASSNSGTGSSLVSIGGSSVPPAVMPPGSGT